MRSLRLMTGALLATAVLLSGCSAGGPGPLFSAVRGSGSACMPARQGQWILMAWVLQNESGSPVTIQSVHLPDDADHLQMSAKTWLVPPYSDPRTKTHYLAG